MCHLFGIKSGKMHETQNRRGPCSEKVKESQKNKSETLV